MPDHADTHVAVQATASRNDAPGIHLHWASGPAPVTRTLTEEPIINVLFHVARCVSPQDALAVWESAIRNKKTSAEILRRVAWRSSVAAQFVLRGYTVLRFDCFQVFFQWDLVAETVLTAVRKGCTVIASGDLTGSG